MKGLFEVLKGLPIQAVPEGPVLALSERDVIRLQTFLNKLRIAHILIMTYCIRCIIYDATVRMGIDR